MQPIATLTVLLLSLPILASNNFEKLVSQDLLKLQSTTSRTNSPSQIAIQNQKALDELANYIPSRQVEHSDGRRRLNAVSYEWAVKAMRSIDRHPTVSSYQYEKYNNKNVEIGFCFGRATYIHLALLKMGVNKDAIKKVWVVGPMKAGSIIWSFHVATVVKGERPGQWWVVDNYPGEVKEVQAWFQYMSESSTNSELKLYISEPNKFSVSIGEYSRVQLGLNLSREQDWYSHYFIDMLTWFRNGTLESIGLKDLRRINTSPSA